MSPLVGEGKLSQSLLNGTWGLEVSNFTPLGLSPMPHPPTIVGGRGGDREFTSPRESMPMLRKVISWMKRRERPGTHRSLSSIHCSGVMWMGFRTLESSIKV